MLIQSMIRLNNRLHYLNPKVFCTVHTETCPENKKKSMPCGSRTSNNEPSSKGQLKRAIKSGKVRLGFIPEEYFVFFYPKTGVTGPYLFGIMLGNYMLSKEIYVMEHDYYIGLSIFVMTYYGTTKLGPVLAASLDKDVDAVEESFKSRRKEEEAHFENIIKEAKDAQFRAKGQNLLIEAKKENVAMQLEAVYRERLMHVYKSLKGRLDYHAKRHRIETNIHQKWMITWILENVKKSITPEIERQALDQAIVSLASLAERAR
ncbi:unnamed protein product [Parnassius mnemosyne]|uniref:ATP synthase subunit b n=1 Tax=Parnassius mnemosyne TaxID=213953 RepID=A0AAV1KZS0_9NEOP